nr:uncharacterized protein LOC109782104 isoform X1 [Aegilops tauschii subsp. strangulata]
MWSGTRAADLERCRSGGAADLERRRRRRGVAASSRVKLENEREGQMMAAIMDLNLLFLHCCSTGCSLAVQSLGLMRPSGSHGYFFLCPASGEGARPGEEGSGEGPEDLGLLLPRAPSGRRGPSLAPLDRCCWRQGPGPGSAEEK